MLALMRRPGESIVIYDSLGKEITIIFVGKSKNQISILIDAPPEIKIYREELLSEKKMIKGE